MQRSHQPSGSWSLRLPRKTRSRTRQSRRRSLTSSQVSQSKSSHHLEEALSISWLWNNQRWSNHQVRCQVSFRAWPQGKLRSHSRSQIRRQTTLLLGCWALTSHNRKRSPSSSQTSKTPIRVPALSKSLPTRHPRTQVSYLT